MELLTNEWLNLAVRWIHVTVGIAWIGTSFLFVWMDAHLRPGDNPKPGVAGELWMVHGGGFYQLEKYLVAPAHLPKALHWFKWESYSTWISGICLLILVYFLGAGAFLVKPGVALSPPMAVAIAVAALVAGWVAYDVLCRLLAERSPAGLAAAVFVLLALAAFGFSLIYSGRGAFIMVGAVIGTIMSANVFFVIIPNQTKLVAALIRGETPNARLGIQGRQRSLHNNYLTLPVLFTMISNHYPVTYGTQWNWLILIALSAIGVAVRHFFNLKNRGRPQPWLLPAAAVAMIALAYVATPRLAPVEAGEVVAFATVDSIIDLRCAGCHAAQPTFEGFDAPPKGIAFDTAEEIRRHAALIRAQAVTTDAMPLGNVTEMTPEERTLLGRWIAAGAPLEP